MGTAEDERDPEPARGRLRDESDSETGAGAPRRPFRVRPISGGYAPGIDPGDPKAFKNLLNDWDDEHFLEVQRRSAGATPSDRA